MVDPRKWEVAVGKKQVYTRRTKEAEQRTGSWGQVTSIPGHGLREAEHLLGP